MPDPRAFVRLPPGRRRPAQTGPRPRLWLALRLGLVAWLVLAPFAAGQESFASLSVTPHGDQVYDLATGLTTLPEGGEVVDRETGITLSGRRIVIEEGRRIEADGATVVGDFGRFEAPVLVFELDSGRLDAQGGLHLVRDGLELGAAALAYHPEQDVAVFSGGVKGSDPSFEAEALLLDTETGDALLIGPYRFQNGPFTLRSTHPGSALQLIPLELETGIEYDADTTISTELLERFETFLPSGAAQRD